MAKKSRFQEMMERNIAAAAGAITMDDPTALPDDPAQHSAEFTFETESGQPVKQADKQAIKQTGKLADRQADELADELADDLAGTQANKRTGKLTDKQTGKLSTAQVGKQISKQADKLINKQASKQTDRHPDEQPDEHAPEYALRHPNAYAGKQGIEHPDVQADKLDVEQPYGQPGGQPTVTKLSDLKAGMPREERFCLGLSDKARAVTRYLLEQQNGLVNMSTAEVWCGGKLVSYGMKRHTWAKLIENGYVYGQEQFRIGAYQGVSYNVLPEFRLAFQKICQSGQPDRQPGEQADRRIGKPLIDSSELNIKPASNVPGYATHPELSLWRDNGVGEKQVSAWCQEFDIDPELMAEYLKWCAWDVQHRPESKRIQNAANWFYGVLKKSGGYPKPDGYKSIEELRAEELEAVKAAKAAAAKRINDAMQADAEAGLKEYFDAMIAAGESDPVYAELKGKLSQFTQRMEHNPKARKVFEQAMWSELKKKSGI